MNKLIIVIHANEINVQEETMFSHQNLKLSLEPLALKPIKKHKVTSSHTLTNYKSNLHKRPNHLFLKKDFYPGNYEKLKTKLFQAYIGYIYFFKIPDNKFWKIHLSHI